ncbi:MAG: hypothetical protein IKP68_03275 [Clostridia bacterium]|nr:hypothetical protein [Clostridia bacterium]
MRKLSFLFVALMIMSVLSRASCSSEDDRSLYYDENGIAYQYGYACIVPFDASGESAEVTILDEYEIYDTKLKKTLHYDVTSAGSRFSPSLLYIEPKSETFAVYKVSSEVAKEKTIIDERKFDLYINVGKNMTSIYYNNKRKDEYCSIFYKEIEDGKLIRYNVNIMWNISPENKVLFSENGRIFLKNKNRYLDDNYLFENMGKLTYVTVGRFDENGEFLGEDEKRIVGIPIDLGGDSCEIEIPEEYAGIGKPSYYPCQYFGVGLGSGRFTGNPIFIKEDMPVYTVYFHIGKNIKEIELPKENILERHHKYIGYISYEYFLIKTYFYCSEENEVFYSKDGVLYYKSNSEPVFGE